MTTQPNFITKPKPTYSWEKPSRPKPKPTKKPQHPTNGNDIVKRPPAISPATSNVQTPSTQTTKPKPPEVSLFYFLFVALILYPDSFSGKEVWPECQ